MRYRSLIRSKIDYYFFSGTQHVIEQRTEMDFSLKTTCEVTILTRKFYGTFLLQRHTIFTVQRKETNSHMH